MESKDVFSIKVRAGKRTYFFDIKATKSSDYYLALTESKRELVDNVDGGFKKRTIFLYKEDVLKFYRALGDSIEHLQSLLPQYEFNDSDDNYNR